MHAPQVIFYRETRNFGDAFNEFLFSEIIDVSRLSPAGDVVFGVGSILSKGFGLDTSLEVLTLGTGVRGMEINKEETPLRVHKNSWSRGVFSEAITGIESIADGAYAFMLHPQYTRLMREKRTGKGRLAIIPHYSSMSRFPWDRVCGGGVQVISPTSNFMDVCEQIAGCEMVLCEAMHGAVFADMLRVPWLRLEFLSRYFENAQVSYLKWSDFYSGIHMIGRNEQSFHHLVFEWTLAREYLSRTPVLALYNERRVRALRDVLLTLLGAKHLFRHSSDARLAEIKARILHKIEPALTDCCRVR